MPKIPVTVFTGYLGSGKTTIIRHLIKQIPSDYKMCLLKNEFGDVKVDSLLLAESNIQVTEMLNGCLCCILVGKLGQALDELMSKYTPERIIIETSGSAYPAPIALEIEKMSDKLYLDGIITVIDVLNFEAYKDTSYTAKIQTEYTDLILMNKHELVDQARYEKVLDWVNELNSTTPKLKTNKGLIDFKYIFGLDRSLKLMPTVPSKAGHQHLDADLFEIQTNKVFEINVIEELLKNLPKWDFFRIKGYLRSKDGGCGLIINYVFGRYTIENCNIERPTQLLFLGKNFSYHSSKIIEKLKLSEEDYTLALRDLN